jgi:hypothetical protein
MMDFCFNLQGTRNIDFFGVGAQIFYLFGQYQAKLALDLGKGDP